MQAKLLQGLGIKSLLISDGHSPINLFNTAQGLIAGGAGGVQLLKSVEDKTDTSFDS